MRFLLRYSFPRWIHWFWITWMVLSIQPHLLKSQETHSSVNSSNPFTTTSPPSTPLLPNGDEKARHAKDNNISVSHTISVVSVLYSSEEANKEMDSFERTTPSMISSKTQKSVNTSTTTYSPPSKLKDEVTSQEPLALKPHEHIRGGKEGRSLGGVHTPVALSVFEEGETNDDLASRNVSSSSIETSEDEEEEDSFLSDSSTFILREKQSTLLEVGESHGSLLTLKESDEPSKESTSSGMSTNMLIGIIMGALLLMIVGTVGFGVLIYHEKFANKPQTLDDNYANSDSGGIYNFSTTEDFFRRISHIECGGFDIGRDTYSEEMYNLDNDSFLNSLEAMTFPSYSPDMNNRSTFSNDSGV